MTNAYDFLIVGAGLAGLYTARELLRKNPTLRVCLVEKYKRVGGRAVTYKKGEYQWEIGAGRIAAEHAMVHGLIKEYGLHTVPIGSGLTYRESGEVPYEENHFEPSLPILLHPLLSLSPSVLGNHTLRELLIQIHGATATQAWLTRFPYVSEMTVMRADMALREFLHEMKGHEGYTVCKEGLSALADAMAEEITRLGGVILRENELIEVAEGSATFLIGSWKDGTARPRRTITATKIILAMEVDALRRLPLFRSWSVAKHVQMEPLFRIYAVFEEAWFHDLTRVVTASPIRYFLPVGEKTAMISYTDSKDARHYMKILDTEGERALEAQVMKNLRELFPEKRIKKPLFFKPHPWTSGVSYWLPGSYEPAEMSKKALNPFHSIYVCGESFSIRQGWMEGALEHANLLLNLLQK